MGDILVLDDVLDAGIMIKRLLERKGHRVAVFTEEEEALAHIGSQATDVAIRFCRYSNPKSRSPLAFRLHEPRGLSCRPRKFPSFSER